MKGITLIKQLNEMIREKDEFEQALAEQGIEFDMGNGEQAELGPQYDDPDPADFDTTPELDDELQRIADHWREEGAEMEDDELRDAIGDDLEQLEYSPEEISTGIDDVMNAIGRGNGEYDEEGDYDEGLEGDEDMPPEEGMEDELGDEPPM